jgi:hypothetical protein
MQIAIIGGSNSSGGLGIFLFTTASRPALGDTQFPVQWVPEALSLGVKRPGVKLTTHLYVVSGARMCAVPPLPNTPSWRGAQLKHRDNFTFTQIGKQIFLQVLCYVYKETSCETKA